MADLEQTSAGCGGPCGWSCGGASLEAFIAQEMRRYKIAGLSIALVDDQQTVWVHGAGWADQVATRPAGPDTLYRMGSVSKLFADTAAMQLVAQGRLDLDAGIEQALPSLHIRTDWGDAPITPRQLMTHHSGLPRDILREAGRVGDDAVQREQDACGHAQAPSRLHLSAAHLVSLARATRCPGLPRAAQCAC